MISISRFWELLLIVLAILGACLALPLDAPSGPSLTTPGAPLPVVLDHAHVASPAIPALNVADLPGPGDSDTPARGGSTTFAVSVAGGSLLLTMIAGGTAYARRRIQREAATAEIESATPKEEQDVEKIAGKCSFLFVHNKHQFLIGFFLRKRQRSDIDHSGRHGALPATGGEEREDERQR